MAALAWLAGAIGGLCMVMGIITATEVVPPITDELTWAFWFALSGLLLLISIALAVGRGEYE
jgi:hypothetical protein